MRAAAFSVLAVLALPTAAAQESDSPARPAGRAAPFLTPNPQEMRGCITAFGPIRHGERGCASCITAGRNGASVQPVVCIDGNVKPAGRCAPGSECRP